MAIKGDTTTGKRGHSSIQFPYSDLGDAEDIANAIATNFPHGCDGNQLAAVMKQSAISGSFRNKVIAARMFGLTEGTKTFTLTPLGFRIVDDQDKNAARVEAFLSVGLFRALFDHAQKSGGKLPSSIASMESLIVGLGVVSSQAPRARQTFQRSARLAGFFEHGEDRLIQPSMSLTTQSSASTIEPMGQHLASVYTGRPVASQLMRDPLIVGMLDRLPDASSPFPEDELDEWIETFKRNLKLIYPKEKVAPTTVRKDGMPSGQGSSGEKIEDLFKQ